jgi:hypothetical protein
VTELYGIGTAIAVADIYLACSTGFSLYSGAY